MRLLGFGADHLVVDSALHDADSAHHDAERARRSAVASLESAVGVVDSAVAVGTVIAMENPTFDH